MKFHNKDVYKSAVKILVPLSPQDLYEVILEEAQELSGAMYGSVFLHNQTGFQRVYSTIPRAMQLQPRKKGYTHQAFSRQKVLVVKAKQLKKDGFATTYPETTQLIFVPMVYENNSFGVIALHSKRETKITADELEVLELFATLVSLRVRNLLSLTQMKTALETRDLFISMASHELKTPLTTISAYAQLTERALAQGKEIKLDWIKTLKLASDRMNRMINELLQVNRIRAGTMIYSFKACSPIDITNQAIKDFTFSFPNQKLKVQDQRTNKKSIIWADQDKLSQVITNLLNNAAKFTEDDKPISLTIATKNKKVFITVEDKGKGIAPEDMNHLFEEFYRAQNNTQQGLGLGLFISKKIIEAHHGKIKLSSMLGSGTQVVLSFPENQ